MNQNNSFSYISSSDNHTPEQEPLDLKDYYKILASNKWYIIIIAAVVIGLGTYKTLTSRPVYQSEAKVMIEKDNKMNDIFQFGGSFSNETMANEIEILQSRELKARLVISLWDSPLQDDLYILGTRKVEENDDSFFTESIDKVKGYVKNLVSGKKTVQYIPSNQNDFIRLNQWVSELIDQLPEGLSLEQLNRIVNRIDNGVIQVSPKRESTIINVSYKSPGKHEAQLVLEKFINIYQQTDEQRSAREITKLNSFLGDKLSERKMELERARDRLEAYQEQELIFGVEEKNKSILEQTTEIESKYYNAQADVEIKEKELQLLRAQLSEREGRLAEKVGSVLDSELRALRGELVNLQAKLVRTVNKYNENHPEVKNINSEIKKIKNKINNKTNQLIQQGISVADPISFSQELVTRILKTEVELEAQKSKEEQYRKMVNRYNEKLKSLPQKQLKYAQLKRELKVLEENYIFLRKKQQETKINRAFEAGKIRIIDHAAVAEKVEPNVKMDILLSVLLGFGLGIGFALLKSTLNNKIKFIDDLENVGVPVLAPIPNIKEMAREISKNNNHKMNSDMVAYFKPLHPISESFRNLRTNINLSTADDRIKSVLITSPGPTEGKTTVAGNLALTYAHMGKKTLIVDCDMRKSNIHNEFNQERENGLVDYLTNDIKLDNIIKETEEENLSVITAGGHPPNPSELLNSAKMKQLMKDLDQEWDSIIYDSPPIIPVTDAVILSKAVDFVILTIMIDMTHLDAVNHAREKLDKVNSEINGLVINGIKKKHSKYGKYSYSYRRYYKYYNEDKGI